MRTNLSTRVSSERRKYDTAAYLQVCPLLDSCLAELLGREHNKIEANAKARRRNFGSCSHLAGLLPRLARDWDHGMELSLQRSKANDQ